MSQFFPQKVKHRKWQTFREHPDKIGVAAVQTKEDLFDTDRSKMRAEIEDKMKELTEE